MTSQEPPENLGDKWLAGEIRVDQIVYDRLGVENRLAGNVWLKTWFGHLYKRDRTMPEAWAKISKWIAVDAGLGFALERKYPLFFRGSELIRARQAWVIYTIYMYAKNPASFNTLFLTGIDSSLRGTFIGISAPWQAYGRGQFPGPR